MGALSCSSAFPWSVWLRLRLIPWLDSIFLRGGARQGASKSVRGRARACLGVWGGVARFAQTAEENAQKTHCCAALWKTAADAWLVARLGAPSGNLARGRF